MNRGSTTGGGVNGCPEETRQSYFDWEALEGIYEVGDNAQKVKITIDSGASDASCPKELAPSFKTVACEPGKATA